MQLYTSPDGRTFYLDVSESGAYVLAEPGSSQWMKFPEQWNGKGTTSEIPASEGTGAVVGETQEQWKTFKNPSGEEYFFAEDPANTGRYVCARAGEDSWQPLPESWYSSAGLGSKIQLPPVPVKSTRHLPPLAAPLVHRSTVSLTPVPVLVESPVYMRESVIIPVRVHGIKGRPFGSPGDFCLGMCLATIMLSCVYYLTLSDSVSHHMIAGMHFGNFLGPVIIGSIMLALGSAVGSIGLIVLGVILLIVAAIFVLLGILKMRSIGAKKFEISQSNGGYLPHGIAGHRVDLSGY